MKHIANVITSSRIILTFILLPIPIFSLPFYLVYALCGFTDMIDGFIARRTNTQSEFGAKLDSVADTFFSFVCLYKVIFAIDLNAWIWSWIALIAIIKVLNIIFGYIFEKRIIMLHTTANKVTGFLLFIWVFVIFFIDINTAALPICMIATFAALQESYYIKIR